MVYISNILSNIFQYYPILLLVYLVSAPEAASTSAIMFSNADRWSWPQVHDQDPMIPIMLKIFEDPKDNRPEVPSENVLSCRCWAWLMRGTFWPRLLELWHFGSS